jgi:hypothetical protein
MAQPLSARSLAARDVPRHSSAKRLVVGQLDRIGEGGFHHPRGVLDELPRGFDERLGFVA